MRSTLAALFALSLTSPPVLAGETAPPSSDEPIPGQYEIVTQMLIRGSNPMPPMNFEHCLTREALANGSAYGPSEHSGLCTVSDFGNENGQTHFSFSCEQDKVKLTGKANGQHSTQGFRLMLTGNVSGLEGVMNGQFRQTMAAKRIGDCAAPSAATTDK